MNLDKISALNHELNNFRNKITRLEEELASIENNDVCEYDQFCELVHMNCEPTIYDIKHLYNTMKELQKSGIEGLKIHFEDMVEENFDGYETEYINARIYGDKKYAQEKLDKRKAEIILEIENYNKRVENYKEQLKVEVNSESQN